MVVLLGLVLSAISYAPAVLAEDDATNNDDEIVYLDPNGVIRVFDPSPSISLAQVDWSSPDGGWSRLALADFTGDGDMEIVAIKPEGEGGRLTIFDPVARDSADDQVEEIDGVPWIMLYDATLPRPPRLLATGEFDEARTGREIIYSYALADNRDRFVVLRQTEGGGRAWEEQRTWELSGRWTAMATGNIDAANAINPIDEVALVSHDRGELSVYRIEPSVSQYFENTNKNNRWENVAFGQFVLGDGAELGAVRDADLPLASVWIFMNNGSTMVDHFSDRLSPSPEVVFFADIGGNGDEELVVLRQVRQELGPRARLVIRDNGNDSLSFTEQLLDGDNEYQGGAAGDVDADGRDEIVVIRNNRIRIYTAPESSAAYREIERGTNRRMVQLGNVDATGLGLTPRLRASETVLHASLEPGEEESAVQEVTLEDVASGANLSFVAILQDAEGWATLSQSGDVTPATLSVTFSATGLQPGEYTGRIVVDVQASGVENDPLAIDLVLTVEPVVTGDPASVDFVYFPCTEPLPVQNQMVALQGPDQTNYTAAIEGAPSWVTVAPEAGVLPAAVNISVDPSLRPSDIAYADLLVTVDLPRVPGIVNRVPIHLICAKNRVYVPMIAD